MYHFCHHNCHSCWMNGWSQKPGIIVLVFDLQWLRSRCSRVSFDPYIIFLITNYSFFNLWRWELTPEFLQWVKLMKLTGLSKLVFSQEKEEKRSLRTKLQFIYDWFSLPYKLIIFVSTDPLCVLAQGPS